MVQDDGVVVVDEEVDGGGWIVARVRSWRLTNLAGEHLTLPTHTYRGYLNIEMLMVDEHCLLGGVSVRFSRCLE